MSDWDGQDATIPEDGPCLLDTASSLLGRSPCPGLLASPQISTRDLSSSPPTIIINLPSEVSAPKAHLIHRIPFKL